MGIVVPSGYSFNLDGTSIYLTMAAIFIAQALGIELSLKEELTLLAVLLLASKGAAGVTGSGFVTLAATLATIPTIPVAGIALILGVDRFMSEARALTNLVGNSVATIVVAKWEGALDMQRLHAELDQPTVIEEEPFLPDEQRTFGEGATCRGKGNPSEEGLSLPPDPPPFPRLLTGGEGGPEGVRSGGSWKRHFPRRRYGWDSPVFPVC